LQCAQGWCGIVGLGMLGALDLGETDICSRSCIGTGRRVGVLFSEAGNFLFTEA
jgi:hypothetical protein